ncbi:MAG: transglycosylase SLT domain-containing protein [Holophagaceae bacterium]|uniref:Transglycosylase SLT domain-containing protein n=1 Tax=Candidatus Geothrix skivensis TaxID=2954439 RepID=A0A9D7SK03_9BACT|nr:transglycosylase SLT domain-containing protein [Candidatus Geothrix skivensis]
MLRPLLLLSLATLALVAGSPRVSKDPVRPGVTYLYTYYDPQGRLVINNLPPAYMKGQGLVLKHVGVGKVRLAVTPAEMARALKSPELIALVDEIAQVEGVDTHLARAIIQAESAFNYKARSRAGALGLMQLMPSTAERFGVLDPFDPRQNISGGVKYLKWLHDYYAGDLIRVVAAYNAGEGAVNKHKGIPPFRETRAYVPRVLDLYHRKAVQADPKLAGSMALLQKGRGGFKVEEQKTVPEPSVQQRAATRVYQWTDASGRIQISDQPPPKGTAGVKPYGGP